MKGIHLISGFLMLSILPVLGCGGSSSSNSITKAQAAAAFGDVLTAMEDAAGALPLDQKTHLSQFRKEEAAGIQKAILNGTRMPVSENAISPAPEVSPDATTTIPTYTYTCPSGGTIVVTGSYSETSTSASASSESATIVETPKSCKDSGITMNGDPNITLSMSASDNGTTTTVTLSMTGGISVGSSSCSTDLTVSATISDKTGTGSETYSGSFCNVAISGSTAT
ncbi:MAG: hypothetical protein ABSC48_11995 [Terracidiphilus sp.]|jgi:hypothetical protein